MSNPQYKNAPKQAIIIRTDLKMRKGKMVSQGAHASLKVFTDDMKVEHRSHSINRVLNFESGCPMSAWLDGIYKKVVLAIDTEEGLLALHNQAIKAGLPASLIQDLGLTEFNEPTYTAVAIGPWWPDDVDEITGKLRLL